MDAGSSQSLDSTEMACYCDGSWKKGDLTSGVGWALQTHQGHTELLGMKGLPRRISPLHTELSGSYQDGDYAKSVADFLGGV
ncbi:unnamed protein product [Cochlearia groenlandica]